MRIARAHAVYFYGNDELNKIKFPSLLTVGTYLDVNQNQNLKSISMPVLTTIDYVNVYSNAELVSLVANKLRSIGSYLSVSNNNDLATVNFTALQNVTTYVTMSYNDNLRYVRPRVRCA